MRYSRQILFEKIGPENQEKLHKSHVTILGSGALGSRSAELLTRAGVNSLTLIDRDIIEESNLHRQTLYTESDIDSPKALAAASHLKKINSQLKIQTHLEDLNYKNINKLISKTDLILDCTDNMDVRFLLNDFCLKNDIPWIYTAIIGSSGMIFNILPNKTPCLRCLLQELDQPLDSCDTSGILNTTVSFASSLQVTEALKHLTSQSPTPDLLYFDVWKNKLQNIKINKQKSCPSCNQKFSYLSGDKSKELVNLCGTSSYQIHGLPLNLPDLASKLEKLDKIKLTQHCLIFQSLIIFKDGRVLIKASSPNEAKSLYSKYIGH